MSKGVRIGEIEVLRVVAAIAVLLCHMSILPGGYLAVEYFAVLSGLLMARGVKLQPRAGIRNLALDTGRYVFKKIKMFYPELLVATILGLLSFNYAKHTVDYSLQYVFHSISGNLLLLKMADGAWAMRSTVPPVWYLSSMFFSILLIYPFLCRTRKRYIFLVPGLLLLSYLAFNEGGVGSKSVDKWLMFAYSGNIRICSEFLIAIGLSPLIGILSKLISESQNASKILNAVKYVSLVALCPLCFYKQGVTDMLFLIFALVYLIIAFASASNSTKETQSVFNKVSRYCGMISIAIFLSHSPALCISGGIAKRLGVNAALACFLAFLVTAIFSYITIYGAKKIRAFFARRQKIISADEFKNG